MPNPQLYARSCRSVQSLVSCNKLKCEAGSELPMRLDSLLEKPFKISDTYSRYIITWVCRVDSWK